jgi:hypothetical protein
LVDGIFTKAVSNQIAPSTNNGDSHWRNIVSFVVADTLKNSNNFNVAGCRATLLYGFAYESGPMVVSALVGYTVDAVELFQLNRSGLWFKDTKIQNPGQLIWHFGSWLVAELNLTKRLVQRLDHNKRLWVRLSE